MTVEKTKKSIVEFVCNELKSIDFKKIETMQDKKIVFDRINDLKQKIKTLMEATPL
jgi:uncharacterized FlgJ-related protein